MGQRMGGYAWEGGKSELTQVEVRTGDRKDRETLISPVKIILFGLRTLVIFLNGYSSDQIYD